MQVTALTLPWPARDLMPLARYLAFDSHASVMTSRGCPYECAFCSAPAWTGRRVRYRTPSLCVDEIQELAALGAGAAWGAAVARI